MLQSCSRRSIAATAIRRGARHRFRLRLCRDAREQAARREIAALAQHVDRRDPVLGRGIGREQQRRRARLLQPLA